MGICAPERRREHTRTAQLMSVRMAVHGESLCAVTWKASGSIPSESILADKGNGKIIIVLFLFYIIETD